MLIDFTITYFSLLQDHILDLTDEIELRKIREEEIIRSHVMDKKHIIDEMDDLKVSQKFIVTHHFCQLIYVFFS